MVISIQIMAYYRLANIIRFESQALNEYFNQIFEISLNASLLSEKLKESCPQGIVLEHSSQKLATISNDLRDIIKLLLSESIELSKYSLQFMSLAVQQDKMNEAAPMVNQNENRQLVAHAIDHFNSEMQSSCEASLVKSQSIHRLIKKLADYNNKIWLSNNNIKIEIASSESLSSFSTITNHLDNMVDQIRDCLVGLEHQLYNAEEIIAKFHDNRALVD